MISEVMASLTSQYRGNIPKAGSTYLQQTVLHRVWLHTCKLCWLRQSQLQKPRCWMLKLALSSTAELARVQPTYVSLVNSQGVMPTSHALIHTFVK